MSSRYVAGPSWAISKVDLSPNSPNHPAVRNPDVWLSVSLVMRGVEGFPPWMIVSILDTRIRRDA